MAPGASLHEIRAAYRRRAKEHHPDRFVTSSPMIKRLAQKRMSELNLAYSLIGPRGFLHEGDAGRAQVEQQRREAVRRHRYQQWEAAERRARIGMEDAYAAAAAEHATTAAPAATAGTPRPLRPQPADCEEATAVHQEIHELQQEVAATGSADVAPRRRRFISRQSR